MQRICREQELKNSNVNSSYTPQIMGNTTTAFFLHTETGRHLVQMAACLLDFSLLPSAND